MSCLGKSASDYQKGVNSLYQLGAISVYSEVSYFHFLIVVEEKERKRSRRSRSRDRKRSRSPRDRKRSRRSRSRDRKRDREGKREEGGGEGDQDFGEDGVPMVKEEDVDTYTGYGGYNPDEQNGEEEEEGQREEEYEG
ncbi:probable ATP-dependent RNA helicase DDX46 [Saccostrea cucullata]|uniref:probable ATP-dependent RNA helicase DDX46 n=1 Tax=Saccostrea cuccullata TaxID=36930 RepID=UPI002ED19F3C